MGADADSLDTVMRRYAQDVADFIMEDPAIRIGDKVTVIVEDKAEIENTITKAVTKSTGGVAVLVAVTGFRRRQNSGRILTGTLEMQVSVHENPLFNRKGDFVMTAQGVAERIASILHWTQLDGWDNRLRVDSLTRSDDNSANIMVVDIRTEQGLRGDIP